MQEITVEMLRGLCTDETITFTQHLQTRMYQRGIHYDDVTSAINSCEIIEQYPTDYPYPSCLLLGMSENGTPLHIVCGVGSGRLWIVTAYHPHEDKWKPGFKARKEPRP